MPVREMHPLCCISIDCPGTPSAAEDADPGADPDDVGNAAAASSDGPDVVVAGVLQKWTNFGRGWRSRWFSLRNGVLAYSKVRSPKDPDPDPSTGPDLDPLPDDILLIGSASAAHSRAGQQQKPIGFVYLKEAKMIAVGDQGSTRHSSRSTA